MINVRRKFALAVAAAAVAVPALSACSLQGFDYATDRPNTIANGGYHLDGPIHVMAARIIAPSDGTGTFVASISADANAETVEFDGIEGVTAKAFAPVEVKPHRIVNLYTEGGIPVSGDFKAGENIPVTVSFNDGTRIKVNAIVVTQCHEYADPAIAGEETSAKAAAAPSASIAAGDGHADDHAGDHATGETDAYSCEYAKAPAHKAAH